MATITRETVGLAVTFAGLGQAGGQTILPLPLATADLRPATGSVLLPYRVLIARDNGIPLIDVADQGVSPVRGDPQQGSLDLEIVIPPAQVEAAAYFAVNSARPVCYALAQLGPTQTIIYVDPAELAISGIVADSIIYWGREAFRVRQIDLISGTIEIRDQIPGGTRSANGAIGVLGHFGTYIEFHAGENPDQLPPYSDSRIYLENPFLKDREICVWISDGENPETVQSTYYLDRATWTNDQTTLEIGARDTLALVAGLQFNSNITTYGSAGGTAYGNNILQLLPGGLNGPVQDGSIIPCTSLDFSNSVINSSGGGLVVVGGQIFHIRPYAGPLTSNGGFIVANPIGLAAISGSPGSGENQILEVISSNPNFYPLNDLGVPSSPYYSSDLGAVADNPMDILRCHLGTISSQLPPAWIVPLPADQINDAEIEALGATVYQGQTWRGILQICDGASFSAMGWLTSKILRPLGASFTTDTSGRLTVRSLFDGRAPVSTVGDESVLIGRGVSFDLEIGVDSIRASTARKITGEYLIRLFGQGAYQSAFQLTRDPQIVDWDAEGLKSAADVLSVADSDLARYSERIARIAALFRYRVQTVNLRVLMTANLAPGQFRTFQIRGLRAPSTGQVEDSPSERFGYVVKVANDPRRWTATVTVILFAIAPRRLGPSGEVKAGGTATVFDLEATTYVAPVPYSPSASGAVVNLDGRTFEVGDAVVLRSPSLAVISNIRVIASVAGSTITLTSAFNVTPSAGDVLTLADIEQAPYPGADDFGFFDVSTFGI
jgi:hypothetical protein